MDKEIFEQIGFTAAETKVYLALLELGEVTAGPLLEETGLQNSTLHKILKRLVKNGFASFIVKGKVHYYTAVDPDYLLRSINEKRQKFEGIMPELKLLQKKVDKQSAEIYEGFAGFKNMLYELIKDAKKGDEYLFFAFYTKNPEDFEYIYTFFQDFDYERHKRGMIIKGILPLKLKDIVKNRKAQLLFVDFPTPLNCSVVGDKIVFTPWEDKKISYLIHSKQLADSYRQLFYSIWEPRKKEVIDTSKQK